MKKNIKKIVRIIFGSFFLLSVIFFLYLFLFHPFLLKWDTVSVEDLKKNHKIERMIFYDGSDINYVRFVYRKSYCSRYVVQAYNRLFNPWWISQTMDLAVYDGIYGDAWNLPYHIKKQGGMTFDIKDGKVKENKLKVGDIIGFYYPISNYKNMARNSGENFTHVALVVGFIDRRAVIAHHFVSPFIPARYSDRVDYLDKITFFKPVKVMRTWRVGTL